jgi:hypothetical protein
MRVDPIVLAVVLVCRVIRNAKASLFFGNARTYMSREKRPRIVCMPFIIALRLANRPDLLKRVRPFTPPHAAHETCRAILWSTTSLSALYGLMTPKILVPVKSHRALLVVYSGRNGRICPPGRLKRRSNFIPHFQGVLHQRPHQGGEQ